MIAVIIPCFRERIFMQDINSFGFIGGDKRQLYCARSIADDGYEVSLCGFDKCKDLLGLSCGSIGDAAKCDALVFPLPLTSDGKTVNAPFSEKIIPLDDSLLAVMHEKPSFCGMKKRLGKDISEKYPLLFDYSVRDEFAVANAVATAEGAIQTAMIEFEGTINGSRCLVAGYGRIGRKCKKIKRLRIYTCGRNEICKYKFSFK